ncbi:tRNA threonylcarbamoyladenosine biosynthesis protein TsaE [Labedella gwakjiensis]|uniref:tRNA threonylcarbamoyladenosine biosynthesis protein TsaE n=1 Tax=Labedella gwakjiensis TaxID=390269 RepID=A0A2P8GRX9_9MICO|nr:tRNA (adenosine(37)-N6)-threonylcarbamoyltransferase complex ATPase subunit type 1 TsaE [Labedella gwakjiensis]PSL36705.1 tRNA threonylcarbamoyladenosine biosynthesis protein TsaE [Labedella gwakjiensis]RUQ84221.1 tRNA (adenosine(37)-N6)-threonylcarbamoyltransferase complex ATPase subunit type 1 TsaE [Labedella gwakjiensis]
MAGERHDVATSDAMHALGVRLGSSLAAGDLLVLTGPLGAGKTTLTRGIGEGLGVRGPVQSPTFVIARTHPSLVGGPPLIHVDAYRLGDPLEFDDLDLDLAHSVVVVEWGREVAAVVADEWLDIEIERPTGATDRVDGADEIDPVDEPRVVTVRTVRVDQPRG